MLPRAILALALATTGCRALGGGPDEQPATAELRSVLDQLYTAFSFDAGAEPNWSVQRALSHPDAVFYSPASGAGSPRGSDLDTFLDEFRAYATAPPVADTGLHERIVAADVETFGGIAHARVVFDAFVPGAAETRRGVDHLQFVRSYGRWKLAAFTTQYEREGLTAPDGWLR